MMIPARFPFLILFMTLLLCPPLFPQADSAKALFTHEDLWLMKRVGGPAPSPDGKWVRMRSEKKGLEIIVDKSPASSN